MTAYVELGSSRGNSTIQQDGIFLQKKKQDGIKENFNYEIVRRKLVKLNKIFIIAKFSRRTANGNLFLLLHSSLTMSTFKTGQRRTYLAPKSSS